jgi:predicted tellurium resistance membrane protein TerC
MNVMNRFHYLKIGLAFLLTFVGLKMLGHDVFKLSTSLSLYIIASILVLTILASLIRSWIIGRRPAVTELQDAREHKNQPASEREP